MAVDFVVPALGESISEATVGQWFKKPGDAVALDEPLCELETDKVTVEVPAPVAGVLGDIKVAEGETVAVGALLGSIAASARASAPPSQAATPPAAGAAAEAASSGPAVAAAPRAPAPPASIVEPGGAAVEITVPALGESVSEATVGRWLKQSGDQVAVDEPLCELETDKVTVEVPAPASGVLAQIKVDEGTSVAIGTVLGVIEAGRAVQDAAVAGVAGAPAIQVASSANGPMPPAPSARKMMAEKALAPDQVEGSGRRGQVLKEDVVAAIAAGTAEAGAPGGAGGSVSPPLTGKAAVAYTPPAPPVRASLADHGALEERVPMSRLRQTIARRLKDAQNNAAILTTFNDADMSGVMKLRTDYKELFLKRHGVKLGFMGFFVKACIQALKEIPAVNAEIDGTDIIYKNYYHIGVAVGSDRGLVVPVVRDADRKSLAEIESDIADLGARARDGKLGIEDLQGGTFTISNGGVYGSMLSTPILNAPQSGILGMHRIEKRAVVVGDEVVVRPMMYLALSYDHRIVDGKAAVTFLVRVKENLEDPQRFLLEV